MRLSPGIGSCSSAWAYRLPEAAGFRPGPENAGDRLIQDLGARLRQIETANAYRRRRVLEGPQQPVQIIDGRRVVAFCSNDYLGLANDDRVREAFRRGVDAYGVGAGAAHLVNGHTLAHHQLEEALAEFTGRERALLFSTGYMANLGVAQALLGQGSHLLEDRLNHASLIDAARISAARLHRYHHADIDDLSRRLGTLDKGEIMISTDAVFSMDGDLAPLSSLARCARDHGAWFMVDDAHGLAVLGDHGAGSLEQAGLSQDDVPILMATLGKALGTAGAFVAGSADLIETLIQSARTYVYTTAMPAALAQATLESLRLVREEPQRRAHLMDLVQRFRRGAAQLGLSLGDSTTPIQVILLGESSRALELSQRLWERACLVPAIRPPTVPPGTARLRITFSAAHETAQVDGLLDALAQSLA